tara:strand:+ start:87 stop:287 length:201 start_codon:yes stop_codon:yes gene_type:complete
MIPDTTYLIIVFIVCILNIILFFKIWKMTNTVEKIYRLSLTKSGYELVEEEDIDGIFETKFVKKNE